MKVVNLYPVVALVGIVISCSIIIPMAIPPKNEMAKMTDVELRINRAEPQRKTLASIEYQIGQNWYQGWYAVSFFTTLEGELYEVHAYPGKNRDPFILDIKDENYPARKTWQERFEDVRQQAKTEPKK